MNNSPANNAMPATAIRNAMTLIATYACVTIATATCAAQQPDYSSQRPDSVKQQDIPTRYVDQHGQPLTYQRLHQLWNNQERTKDDLPLCITRRVPVYMKVAIDQRNINDLLKSCADSRPALEIRDLRISQPEKREFQYQTNVEIFGVLHIFNPVDEELLRMKPVETAKVITDRERG